MIHYLNRALPKKDKEKMKEYLKEFPKGMEVGKVKIVGSEVYINEDGAPCLRARRRGHKFSEWVTIRGLRIMRANARNT